MRAPRPPTKIGTKHMALNDGEREGEAHVRVLMSANEVMVTPVNSMACY